ncbi:MAG: 4Fe-4S binding protein [Dehalobacter sp. 4CP]|uniref:4Fe-4S binding protein n=1 Tax=Dehalobacter sp. CP TaxID=2594474 RepID=UPI0013C67C11|nr:4Fe-4S binding protein [Dehalobacter sp.]NBJ15927.1 4Fe-4S binding protein [Dehalobacter sp. 4CP]
MKAFRKFVTLAAILVLLVALGFSWTQTEKDLQPFLIKALPEAQVFKKVNSSPSIYQGIKNRNGNEEKVGYVVIDEAVAYGGPIVIVTGIDLQGKIVGVIIADHKDTPSYIQKITEKKYLEQFIGKIIVAPLSIDKDIDRISGATYSSKGIAKAVSKGSHEVARRQFGLVVQDDEEEPFKFGAKEIAVIVLVALMLIGVALKRRRLRWVTLISSLVLIGFWYNTPVSLANIAGLLMGHFPPFHENLVWYVFLIGIPLITLTLGKNVYCFWLCPFGALQELTAKIGGGKFKCCNKSIETKIAKLRYVLVYMALIGAFLTKTPSFAGYEPFSTLFGRQGFGIQWLILPVVFFASFFIQRFWCRFFCPGLLINEIILHLRKWIKKMSDKIVLYPANQIKMHIKHRG